MARAWPISFARSVLAITLATVVAALVSGFPAAAAESGGTVLTSEGWTIEARNDCGRLTIKHERLGTMLSEVRLVPDYYTKVLGLPHHAPLDTSVFDRWDKDKFPQGPQWIAGYIEFCTMTWNTPTRGKTRVWQRLGILTGKQRQSGRRPAQTLADRRARHQARSAEYPAWRQRRGSRLALPQEAEPIL